MVLSILLGIGLTLAFARWSLAPIREYTRGREGKWTCTLSDLACLFVYIGIAGAVSKELYRDVPPVFRQEGWFFVSAGAYAVVLWLHGVQTLSQLHIRQAFPRLVFLLWTIPITYSILLPLMFYLCLSGDRLASRFMFAQPVLILAGLTIKPFAYCFVRMANDRESVSTATNSEENPREQESRDHLSASAQMTELQN
jgi:hypothetical protein